MTIVNGVHKPTNITCGAPPCGGPGTPKGSFFVFFPVVEGVNDVDVIREFAVETGKHISWELTPLKIHVEH